MEKITVLADAVYIRFRRGWVCGAEEVFCFFLGIVYLCVMKRKWLLYIVGLLLLLSACADRRGPYPERLLRASRLVEARPDSALACLDSLGVPLSGLSEEARMYAGLLRIKACDKLYIPHASDSAINRIVEFYEHFGDRERLAEAYFYQGSVYRDLKDAPRALLALQAAAAQKSTNDTLNGRIYGQLASLFAYQGAYEESKEAIRNTYIYNIRCKDYKGLAYSYRNMARMFDKEAEKDSAEFYYQKAYRVMKEKAEPKWAYGILSELSSFYSNWGKPDSAAVLAKVVLSRYAYPVAQLVLAETYYRQQAFDLAQVYCRKVLATGDLYHRCSAYLLLARTAEQVDSIRDYLSCYLALQDSIDEITRTEAVLKVHYQQMELENTRLALQSSRRLAGILVLTLVVLALGGLSAFFVYRLRHYRCRLAALEEHLHTFYEARLVYGNEYVSTLQQSEIYLFFHRCTESRSLTPEHWQMLAAEIDKAYPSFTRHLVILYPRIKEAELHTCYLMKIGVPRSRMAVLLNYSVSGISTLLARLHVKLTGKKGSAKDVEKLIEKL